MWRNRNARKIMRRLKWGSDRSGMQYTMANKIEKTQLETVDLTLVDQHQSG